MPKPQYRAAVIGLTGIGARRAAENPAVPLYGPMPGSHADAYCRHPQTRVVAVCDLKQDLLQSFKNNWQDAWPDVRLYTDYRELLEKEKPDIVSVATSDHFHADITVAAAEMGARAIFCEKPIATSLEDADRMIGAAQAHNVLLSVDHTRRWDPKFVKARQIVRSGDIGPLRTVVAEQIGPRAMLFRNGTHIIDVICYFAESAAKWLVAELEEGFDHFTSYVGDGGHDPNTDPYASAYIHFANRVRGFYNAMKTKMPGGVNHLTCGDGRIEISDRGLQVVRSRAHYQWDVCDILPDSHLAERQLAGVAELVHVLENGGELVSSGREARRTLEIMLGILESHRRGNVRVDLPLGS